MTDEEIKTVELALMSAQGESIITSIATIRNVAGGPKAPKYLTQIKFKNPGSDKEQMATINTLATLRHIKKVQRYNRLSEPLPSLDE